MAWDNDTYGEPAEDELQCEDELRQRSKRTRWTATMEAQLTELYTPGKKLADIAEEMGLPPTVVYSKIIAMKKAGELLPVLVSTANTTLPAPVVAPTSVPNETETDTVLPEAHQTEPALISTPLQEALVIVGKVAAVIGSVPRHLVLSYGEPMRELTYTATSDTVQCTLIWEGGTDDKA